MSNTYSGTLVTPKLLEGSITNLTNVWAPLAAFSRDFEADLTKPLAQCVLKQVTSGATAQTNATNFESGNSTVGPITATPAQISVSFQVSNADLNNGLRMDDLLKQNMANFANAVIEVVTAPITVVNFPTGQLVSSAAAFGFSDLATLQASLKKSPIKNLVIDGAYLARVSNSPGFLQPAGTVGGPTNAWKAFGWDGIYNLTDWTGAGTSVQGFACNPQAIVCAFTPPVATPGFAVLSRELITLPGLNITIAKHEWINTSTRTMWCSFDLHVAAALGDSTAGVIITSA